MVHKCFLFDNLHDAELLGMKSYSGLFEADFGALATKVGFVRTGDLSAQCSQGHYRLRFFSGALKSAVAYCFQASQYDRISVSASRSRSSIASNASTFT